jgi:hypothetical protein
MLSSSIGDCGKGSAAPAASHRQCGFDNAANNERISIGRDHADLSSGALRLGRGGTTYSAFHRCSIGPDGEQTIANAGIEEDRALFGSVLRYGGQIPADVTGRSRASYRTLEGTKR